MPPTPPANAGPDAGRHRDPPIANPADGAVAIVAELRANHYGDRERLERMIRKASAAGADFVKLQKREVSTFYPPEQLQAPFHSPFGTTFRDYREGLELSAGDFERIAGLCRELELGWFVSVLDRPSFEFVKAFAPAMVKIPSTVSRDEPFLKWIAGNYDGDIVVSTGMADEGYVSWVVETFAHNRHLYLLQCTSAYPAPIDDCCIAVVRSYARLAESRPGLIPGYSSHDAGWRGSALAVAAGARILEKHVTLEPIPDMPEDPVALDLTTSDFADYVGEIRLAERLMGSSVKTVRPSENHKYASP